MPSGKDHKRVAPGDRLKIPASVYNDALAVIADYKKQYRTSGSGGDSGLELIRSKLDVTVKNATGVEFKDNWRVLRVGPSALDFGVNPVDVNNRHVFYGYTPVAADEPFVVTQTPINIDEFGPCVFAGITVCQVLMNDISHTWANPVPGRTDYLQSATSGQAKILDFIILESGPDDPSGSVLDSGAASGVQLVLAIVNLLGPSPASGPPVDSDYFPVKVTASHTIPTRYSFVEQWLNSSGVMVDKSGGRVGTSTNSGFSMTGTFSVNDKTIVRKSPLDTTKWEMVSVGSVRSVGVTLNSGITGSVANSTTTPVITLGLGDITPNSVQSNTFLSCGTSLFVGANASIGGNVDITGNLDITGELDVIGASLIGEVEFDVRGAVATDCIKGLQGWIHSFSGFAVNGNYGIDATMVIGATTYTFDGGVLVGKSP